MLGRHRRSKSAVVNDEKKESTTDVATPAYNNNDNYNNGTPFHHDDKQPQQYTFGEGNHVQENDNDDRMRIPAIFAAPTVDTLDDQSLFVANGKHRVRGPLASSKNHGRTRPTPSATGISALDDDDDKSGVTRHVVSFTPTSTYIDNAYTFDTFGGGESEYTYNHTAQSPTRKNNKNGTAAAKMGNFADFASPQAAQSLISTITGTNNNDKATKQPNPATTGRKRRAQSSDYNKKPRDFQHSEDAMTVQLRPVNVAQRAAFDTQHNVPSLEEWHMTAQRLAQQHQQQQTASSGASSRSSAAISAAQKKLSPSLQHLKLLHALQNITTIRQLAFSPSVGIDSDAFVPWWEDALPSSSTADSGGHEKDSNNKNNKAKSFSLKRRTSSTGILERRDGRYRSIHPVQATLSGLPSVPPTLSNKKARLPLRSDVGFPNASPEEIQQKCAETQQETEWEEASPRIIVLVTSDDLGTAVEEEHQSTSIHNKNQHMHAKGATISKEHWEFNGGGLQSMPFAGKDLLRAKELNALHFSKKSSLLSKVLDPYGNNSSNNNSKQKLLEPNRTSMLAPPLDASFSKTLGWRPRPFHDRPPGMEYLLCWPLDISFDVGNVEPLLCSLALYSLPTSNATLDAQNTGADNGVVGKLSEEFWFPAGDWDGKMMLDPSFLNMPNAAKPESAKRDHKRMTSIDEDAMDSWSRRKQKAIFSYDPLAIRGGKASLFWVLEVYKVANEDAGNIYVPEKCDPKVGKRSSSVKKLFKGKSPTKPPTQEVINEEKMKANKFFEKFGTDFMTPLGYGVTAVTQPSLLNDKETKGAEFPKGAVLDCTLRAAPLEHESQEDFLHRLTCLALSLSRTGNDSANGIGISSLTRPDSSLQAADRSAALDVESVAASCSDHFFSKSSSAVLSSSASDNLNSKSLDSPKKGSPPTKHKKTSIVKRIFVSPKKAPRPGKSSSSIYQSDAASASTQPTQQKQKQGANENIFAKEMDPPLAATARIFSSALSTDWLQALLSEPTDMDGKKLPLQTQSLSKNDAPKLLCDVSGDYAVMLEGGDKSHKRSNLARLPCHKKSSGYALSAEIREMLYLPARPEKKYDMDAPSFRSMLNLLYLYPRLLRSSSDQQVDAKQKKRDSISKYTVRVRLVRSSLDVDGNKVASSNTPLEAFHSFSPWAEGSPLSKEVYTKVAAHQLSSKHKNGGRQDGKVEQPMKDEMKLRLPMILDGTFFLQFTLFDITSDGTTEGAGVSLRAVGESSIPLSSSTIRDTTGGMKIATVIPNGCHRLKVGDFRLYVESRLVSSVHIGDAAVAVAVRDFPVAAVAENSVPPNRAILSRFSPVEIPVPLEHGARFSALFFNASEGTLCSYFQLLLYSHLSNLVQGQQTGATANFPGRGDFMVGNLLSFFRILEKVKRRLDPARLNVFLKMVLDEFDESTLRPKNRNGEIDDDASDLGSEVDFVEAITGSTQAESSIGIVDMDEDFLDEGAVRVRHKDSLRDGIEKRLNRRKSVDGASLSRVAYGNSKMDRLKAEAELYYDGVRFAHLYDDDETIMTAGTALLNITDIKQRQLAAAALERQQNRGQSWAIDQKNKNGFYSDRSLQAATAAASKVIQSHQSQDANMHDDGFATRVKSVANTIIAPCVGNQGPPGSSPRRLSLDCGRSKRRSSVGSTTAKAVTTAPETAPSKTGQDVFVLPGSQDDQDEERNGKKSRYSAYRGFCDDAVMTLSIQGGRPNQNEAPLLITGGTYLYESIIFLWINAWSDYNLQMGGTNDVPIFVSPATKSNVLFGFISNMNTILPLCLKSLAVRYGVEVQASNDLSIRALLDAPHMTLLESFAEILAKGVMGQALTYSSTSTNVSDEKSAALLRALASADLVGDWFVGLFPLLHPEHMRKILSSYFESLNECETTHLQQNPKGLLEFQWTEQNIHRVRSSRQLRLQLCEKLAVLPSYLALNFPPKFADKLEAHQVENSGMSSWKEQYGENGHDGIVLQERPQPTRRSIKGDARRPASGWLAQLLANEALNVCALSCEAVVAEAMAQVELSNEEKPNNKEDPNKKCSLQRTDLLMFQSLAIHAITAFYELVLRRNAMDRRFQTDTCRGRIAALYAECLFTQSLKSVRWLARMESSHKVRSLWMLCLIYVLQEAPEVLIRNLVRSYCDKKDILIHRFIRLLRLASSTFQSFVDQKSPRHCTFPDEIDEGISPWLLQESFNTICATANVVVEECVKLTESNPKEQRKMIHAVLDLFLHILTTPQSAVTHLRAVGGAIFALEKFGVELFLDVVGDNLQHWVRVIQSLMNSTSLSVRSISVDFVISLFGGAFDLLGCVDEIFLVFASVLPEVVAREIGLFSVDGLIRKSKDLESAIWPLRRSFADLEDANPLDDDRIDPELSPVLKTFCRASQAVLDGVLIELRLKKDKCAVVGTRVEVTGLNIHTFDADEESLFEAAAFFLPETAPLQRLRWLLTLKSLQEAKGQWVEAAECLVACATTISDAMPHLTKVWRPTRFALWSDARRSTWLSTVGEDMGHPDRDNTAVMAFADDFLEPRKMLNSHGAHFDLGLYAGRLQQPTMAAMCSMLSSVSKEAVQCYLREDGMDEVAYSRLENLLKTVMNVLSDHNSQPLHRGRSIRAMNGPMRKQHVEEEAALRRVVAALSADMTKLAERLLLLVQDTPGTPQKAKNDTKNKELKEDASKQPCYVLVEISGAKPPRFLESTTLPTFLDFGMSCVCRVPQATVDAARKAAKDDSQKLSHFICLEYGEPLKLALGSKSASDGLIVLCANSQGNASETRDPTVTYIEITSLSVNAGSSEVSEYSSMSSPLESKKFFYVKKPALVDTTGRIGGENSGKLVVTTPSKFLCTLVEVTVAKTFPSALSRQRTLLKSEIVSSTLDVA